MKVLVTGGSGFIARNLVERLGTKFEISAPSSRELDLLDEEKVREFLRAQSFDVVVHTATYDAAPKHSTKNPSKVLECNLRMFFSLIRCSSDFGKFIYFGSGAEFGRAHWSPRMPESFFDAHVPPDQYGFSKYLMTKYALTNANVVNLRLFATFGKYEDWRVRVTSNVCHKVAEDQPILLNCNRRYDFLFVDDLVRIVEWFMLHQSKHRVYNICSGEVIGFEELAHKILALSGKNLPVQILDPEDRLEYSGDNARLLEELPDFRFTPFDTSIGSLYRWYTAMPGTSKPTAEVVRCR